MARRGTNLFKRNDGLRALRIARDGGIEPAMIEIVAKDGTIFRVYGDNATLAETTQEIIRDGVLTIRQQKTGATLAIPVHPDLAAIIAATPIGHLTLLTTKKGKSRVMTPMYSAMNFGLGATPSGCRSAACFTGCARRR